MIVSALPTYYRGDIYDSLRFTPTFTITVDDVVTPVDPPGIIQDAMLQFRKDIDSGIIVAQYSIEAGTLEVLDEDLWILQTVKKVLTTKHFGTIVFDLEVIYKATVDGPDEPITIARSQQFIEKDVTRQWR